MPNESLQVERVGPHVLLVRINRPEKRNAVNGAVAAGIDKAVSLSENDASIRAVILASTGQQSFCAGADLAEVVAGRGAELSTTNGGFAGLVSARRTKPWVAAVDAPALGGGLELCLACDLIVASSRAQFGLPEVKRGLIAGAGGVFRIARRIPLSIAYEMLATGDPIDAERAFSLGLVNRVVAAGTSEAVALEFAAKIAENAPISVQRSMYVARQALDLNESALFEKLRDAIGVVMATEDSKEGPRAFVEKRKPHWSGR
jgi:enoyl-CoA hydratase/carnithine racemase